MAPIINADVPDLPPNCQFSYVNEGAANIVYKIRLAPGTPPPSSLDEYGQSTPPPTEIENGHAEEDSIIHNKLLRIRKNIESPKCADAQLYWEKYIRPRFDPSEIVHQSLFRLDPQLVTRLNNELKEWERKGRMTNIEGLERPRLETRRGAYLAHDKHGLLVTDMTPGQYFVEFKPKWLVQSPTAPPASTRCRTCALAAMTKATATSKASLKSPVCPLDLVSNNEQDVTRAAELLFSNKPTKVSPARLVRWLRTTPLFHDLRKIQYDLDKTGVLDEENNKSINIRVAMTLRDCTAFVRFPENEEDDDHSVEARLGDLDLKGEGKEIHWRKLELRLINEGWYEGKEIVSEPEPSTCHLARVR